MSDETKLIKFAQVLWGNPYKRLFDKLCHINEPAEKERYEITDFLFNQIHYRKLVGSTLFRHKEAVIGIIEFLMENPEITNSYAKWRIGLIIKYFNQSGAVKVLSYFKRDFFKAELEKKKDALLNRIQEFEIENE